MKFYFKLQFKRLYRHLKAAGANPIIALIALGILFFLVSNRCFQLTDYANFLYPAIGLSLINSLGGAQRITMLKSCFPNRTYYKIRLLENALFASLFLPTLLFHKYYFTALVFFGLAIMLSFFNNFKKGQLTIPTPFSKRPFEFCIGFRISIVLLLLNFVIAGIAFSVKNFNLAVFTLVVSYFVCLNYYSKAEPQFYIWIHKGSSRNFLITKSTTAIYYSTLLSLPILIPLLIIYPKQFYIPVAIVLLGVLFILSNLLGKYAYYPTSLNLISAISLTISLFFPPFLLIILVLFYFKSIKKLDFILK